MGFFHLKQKMSERKAVKFYRSYWEVAMQLNDKDRLAFYDALMLRQFTGEQPDLKGMANFAYISQKHSIDAQVKGFEDKTKTPSKRLRAVLFLMWKQLGEVGDFETYYRVQVEKVIEHLKAKLD